MKRELALILTLAMLAGPALPALAAEADTAKNASATAEAAQPEAAPAPDLPAAKDTGSPAAVPEDVTPTAEPELPKAAPAAKPKPEEPESPYKFKNFALGFLGGALLGGAIGVELFSQDEKGSFDPEKAKVMGPVIGGIVGLSFGLAAFLLGTTTPVEVKPPKVETEEGLRLLAPTQNLAGLKVQYDWSF
jgi:hypothetical protein